MKRRAFCVSAAAALGATALPFGRAFSAVSAVTRDVEAVKGDGKRIALSRADVEDFRAGLRGQLLLPGLSVTTTLARSTTACSIAGPR